MLQKKIDDKFMSTIKMNRTMFRHLETLKKKKENLVLAI